MNSATAEIKPWVVPGLKTVDDVVAEIWGIDKEKLYVHIKKREIVEARMVAMQYRNKVLGLSLSLSAYPYSLNHTAVVHANKTICNLLQSDPAFRIRYGLFQQAVQSLSPR